MSYEYEDAVINELENIEDEYKLDYGNEIKEVREVYRKAKCFDEILKIDNQATDEDRITGQYESDIETVLSEYEEANDET